MNEPEPLKLHGSLMGGCKGRKFAKCPQGRVWSLPRFKSMLLISCACPLGHRQKPYLGQGVAVPTLCLHGRWYKNHLTAVLCKRTDLLNIMVMRQFCGPRYTNITSCWGSGRLPNSYIIDGFWVDSTNDDQGRKTEEEKTLQIFDITIKCQ